MARRVVRLTVDTCGDLPDAVRSCLHWELDPVRRARVADTTAAMAEKEAWISRVLLEWGSCGRVVYVDDEAAGFVLYAPPIYFPGSASYPTAPVSDDAVQLATAQVFERYAGAGLGRLLMQEMVKDLAKRGDSRAVECLATTAAPDQHGLLPAEFLGRVGFKTQRSHPRNPRMRLDLRSVVSWREEVESALERLLGAVRPARPVPASLRVGRRHRPGRNVGPLSR